MGARIVVKVILSRKGFDSSSGGVASPILPDGTLLSLPIPDAQGTVTYADLHWQDHAVGTLVESLTRKRIKRHHRAHLDPDLYPQLYSRHPEWRPLFGQDGAAQTHLANQGVDVGDLFLFFGWFRKVRRVGRGYRFVSNAPDQHVLYGWLQVGAILRGNQFPEHAPAWAAHHPHCCGGRGERNTLYLAADQLTLLGVALPPRPAAGFFPQYDERLVLTAPGALRTRWRLPGWFYPTASRKPLSYHGDTSRWSRDEEFTYLRSAMRGQEFVLDTADYPETLAWLAGLFER